jgi:hypothetical protein
VQSNDNNTILVNNIHPGSQEVDISGSVLGPLLDITPVSEDPTLMPRILM